MSSTSSNKWRWWQSSYQSTLRTQTKLKFIQIRLCLKKKCKSISHSIVDGSSDTCTHWMDRLIWFKICFHTYATYIHNTYIFICHILAQLTSWCNRNRSARKKTSFQPSKSKRILDKCEHIFWKKNPLNNLFIDLSV